MKKKKENDRKVNKINTRITQVNVIRVNGGYAGNHDKSKQEQVRSSHKSDNYQQDIVICRNVDGRRILIDLSS